MKEQKLNAKTAEERAMQLVDLSEAKMPPIARRFVQAYETEYGCHIEVFLYALRRYAASIEKLPHAQPEQHQISLPTDLAGFLNRRNRIMRKFLSRHTYKPSIAAKYRGLERA